MNKPQSQKHIPATSHRDPKRCNSAQLDKAARLGEVARLGFALLAPFALMALLAPEAPANENPESSVLGSCYKFSIPDTPERSDHESAREEIWCYRPLDNPAGSRFIFNADEGTTRPELAAIVESDGSILHASLLQGELTVHRLKPSLNPFNPLWVPLEAPADATRIAAPGGSALQASADETLKYLLTANASSAEISIREGDFEALASAQAIPWRGYWWPYKSGALHTGSNSPLAKYDRFVEGYTGRNPGAVSWEKSQHRYSGVAWEGHCNGWAASSILRREPRSSRRDARSGESFSVSDQKGLLAEKDFCAKYSFFGKRYRRPGDNIRDIDPATFHQVITYYIGQLRKPVVMDRFAGRPVDNHAVSGYTTTVRRTGASTLSVVTTLKIHGYDKGRTNAPGSAPYYTRTFKYTLREGAEGRIIGGSWQSNNPDFIWVPLSPATCGSSNPRVSESWVKEILSL